MVVYYVKAERQDLDHPAETWPCTLRLEVDNETDKILSIREEGD